MGIYRGLESRLGVYIGFSEVYRSLGVYIGV